MSPLQYLRGLWELEQLEQKVKRLSKDFHDECQVLYTRFKAELEQKEE